MKVPKRLLRVLEREDSFLIAAHIDPDGDAIGSALALSAALESMGKKTFLFSRDAVPKYYKFLPGRQLILQKPEGALGDDPALVLVDCNSPKRAALDKYVFRLSIVIDHHETESGFGDVRWIDHRAAATGMMIYNIVSELGVPITADMATNLYTAISVDTGTFRYSNTSAEVLDAAACLVRAGARPGQVSESLYEAWELKRFNLLVMMLNTLEIKNGMAVCHITEEMFRKTGTSSEDTENFSTFPRMIGSVKVSALLRAVGRGMWKASLRSKGGANVAGIAEAFGGGGHKNAAGFTIKGDLKSVKAALFRAENKITV